ncbi:MAG: hypothetical protein PHV77_02545 [Candidatus Omnitrophica bacterium]|nr:hypothetical protein [Candidatus Omnitrophota bacterium]
MLSSKEGIARTKEFIELWKKFNQIYKEAMGKSAISEEEELLFLETKSIVARKFQTLVDSLAIERATIDRTYDVINNVLSLKSISTISEEAIRKMDTDWHQSYISLNRLLGHLEAQLSSGPQGGGLKLTSFIPAAKLALYGVVIFAFFMAVIFFWHVIKNAQ